MSANGTPSTFRIPVVTIPMSINLKAAEAEHQRRARRNQERHRPRAEQEATLKVAPPPDERVWTPEALAAQLFSSAN